MGMSGGSQTSSSSSKSQAMTDVWGPQADALKGMFGQATSLMGSQMKSMPGAANAALGGSMPGMNAASSALQNLAKTGGASAAYAKPNNALAQQQSNLLSQQIGTAFNRDILPGITSASIGTGGGLGSSRDALARGVAAGDAARAISQGTTDLYAQQYGIGAQMAQAMDTNRLGASTALPGVSESMYNLRMQPYQSQWAPLMSAASVFGDPTVLSKAMSQSRSKGSGNQWGFNLF